MEAFVVVDHGVSLAETVDEVALVGDAVFPDVDAFAVGEAFVVVALVFVAVGEVLFSPAVFEKIFETTLVSLTWVITFYTRACFVDSLALDDPSLPLPHVVISFGRGPHAHSVSFAGHPLSGVALAVVPFELALAVFFALLETADVDPAFAQFVAFYFEVAHPPAFE